MYLNDKVLLFLLNETTKLYERQELGDTDISNNGFNQSFVIDGTKDSAKYVVYSYTQNRVKPFSIVFHNNTNTWWIVDKDNVERYRTEGGFLYKHTLSLNGCFELLNARDLTDHGYNANRYTIDEFIKRLFKMSTFEFDVDIVYGTNVLKNLNKDEVVDYVKTFENYSLASALREFLDGYNCSCKLTFEHQHLFITNAVLTIIPKSGDITKEVIDIDYFDDVREFSSNSKESYGEIVVSNAQNVISTKAKVFPTTGGVKLTGTKAIFNASESILRLPSNVYSIEWLKIFISQTLTTNIRIGETEIYNPKVSFFNADSIPDKIIEALYVSHSHNYISLQERVTKVAFVESIRKELVNSIKKACTITLYSGVNVRVDTNGITHFVAPKDNANFYLPVVDHTVAPLHAENYHGQIALVDKEIKDNLSYPWQGICWERGKNYLSGFDLLARGTNNSTTNLVGLEYTDLKAHQWNNGWLHIYGYSNELTLEVYNTYYQVKYIPMTELKVKVDNDNVGENTHLFNQNGKLTDSVAFSKVVNSYVKEVSSETITKYKTFHSLDDVPSVGQMVNNNGEIYVINNISLDFTINEETDTDYQGYQYYIVGEFTMSKNVATKSAMVNPNTNIRDYQIPQNYNVKRKQLYRDYYELDFTVDPNADNQPYLLLDQVLNLSNEYQQYQDHTALICCDYSSAIGGQNDNQSTSWYYKLETTTYVLKKALYEVVDFNDNNIIGYSSQNIYGGFDITAIISGTGLSNINTPVGYVDNFGEVLNIELLMCNYEQLNEASTQYLDNQGIDVSNSVLLNNYPVFIPYGLYNIARIEEYYDYKIEEIDYKKDATEVPVFEYSCQIANSENVIVCNNILDTQEDDILYFYRYYFVDHNKYNEDNVGILGFPQRLIVTQGYSNSGKTNGLAYDSSETYYIGDIVKYNNVLYECIVDNVTGTWDISKWQETNTKANASSPNNNDFMDTEVVKIDYVGTTIVIKPYLYCVRSYSTGATTYNTHDSFNNLTDFVNGKDIVILREKVNSKSRLADSNRYTCVVEPLFIIRNNNVPLDENGNIVLKINHYKVK